MNRFALLAVRRMFSLLYYPGILSQQPGIVNRKIPIFSEYSWDFLGKLVLVKAKGEGILPSPPACQKSLAEFAAQGGK